jgi:hypothetical protein
MKCLSPTYGLLGSHTEGECVVAVGLLPVVVGTHCVHPKHHLLLVLHKGVAAMRGEIGGGHCSVLYRYVTNPSPSNFAFKGTGLPNGLRYF